MNVNRRNWLKAGTLMAGGLALGQYPAFPKAHKKMQIPVLEEDLGQTKEERPPLKARLLANENPFGPSDKAKQALINAVDGSYRYAFEEFKQFKEMIAEKEQVTPDHIMLGAGSSEILLAGALAYGTDGKKILAADITYMDLLRKAQMHGAAWDQVPLNEDLDYDLDAMMSSLSAQHSLVYLVNPNNPVGKSIDPSALKAFCDQASAKKPVFIDEAYIDFKDDVERNSMIQCVREGKNVVVARTFSKLHAFAGLRVGYAIAQPETIELLSKYASGGGTISRPSIMAAMASYQDETFQAYSKEQINLSKAYLYKTLEEAGYDYVKSDTNFVLFPLKYMSAERFQEEMFKRGVGIRKWSFRDKEWCRVSIGTMAEMKIFGEAFQQLA